MTHPTYHLRSAEATLLAFDLVHSELIPYMKRHNIKRPLQLCGVPRGGVPAAYLVQRAAEQQYLEVNLTDDMRQADVLIDDIIDSGHTKKRVLELIERSDVALEAAEFPRLFVALIDKTAPDTPAMRVLPQLRDSWIVFPWEQTNALHDTSADDIPRRLLQFVGEDPNREGLRETPARFLKAWRAYTSGYSMEPSDVLKTFEDGAEHVDEMVIVRDIPLYSHCEHHLAPFFGVAHVAYIPNGKVVGLSKLARLVDMYARRLQVQERLTQQVAHALETHLAPRGVGVVVSCRHMCMEARGVRASGTSTVTSCLLGVLKEDVAARAELLRLLRP